MHVMALAFSSGGGRLIGSGAVVTNACGAQLSDVNNNHSNLC